MTLPTSCVCAAACTDQDVCAQAEAPLADSTQPDPQRMSVAAAAEVEVLRRAKDDALAAQARAEAEVGRLQLDISAGQAALLQLGEEADQAKARAKEASQKLAVVQQEVCAGGFQRTHVVSHKNIFCSSTKRRPGLETLLPPLLS